jgi:hypothetical protein
MGEIAVQCDDGPREISHSDLEPRALQFMLGLIMPGNEQASTTTTEVDAARGVTKATVNELMANASR